jgi:hypothetical protein
LGAAVAAVKQDGSGQRGFVVGLRRGAVARERAADFFAADDRFALARAFLFAALRRGAAARAPADAVAPVDTRVECFGRCLTALFGAASASDVALNATSSATSSNLT